LLRRRSAHHDPPAKGGPPAFGELWRRAGGRCGEARRFRGACRGGRSVPGDRSGGPEGGAPTDGLQGTAEGRETLRAPAAPLYPRRDRPPIITTHASAPRGAKG